MHKVLVFGSNGLLGSQIAKQLLNSDKYELLSPSRDLVDLTSDIQVRDYVSEHKPDFIINCAGYNLVDQCEIDEEQQAMALKLNVHAPELLSKLALEHGARFVTFSTDYVFDGTKGYPYSERDEPNPISSYGKSKLLGEKFILDNTDNFLIFRTSGIISRNPNNFIFKIISASKSQKELKIVDDQITSLNFSGFLAEAVLKILKDHENDEDKSKGIFNLVGPNYGSWYDFAKFTQHLCSLKGINSRFAKINIVPVNTEEMNFKAKRPKFSHLSSDKIKNSFSLSLPNWEKSIEEVLS